MGHPSLTQRCWSGTKKHGASAVIAMVMGTVTGSIVPMLEQWHSDKQIQSSLDAVEARGLAARNELKADIQRQLDEIRHEQELRDKAQWDAIARKKDKTP